MSAHRTGSKDYFRHLDQIALGDEIFMYGTNNTSYRYKVVDIEIVEPDDWSVTDATDYPALTLLSCQEFQGVSNGRRIMIRAKLDSMA